MRSLRLGVISLVILTGATSARGQDLITEFFDYGPNEMSLGGQNGGTGWAGAWGGSSRYFPANWPDPNVPYYDHSENAASAGNVTSGGANSSRSFATPLTGTVWLSFIIGIANDGGDPDAALALNHQDTSSIGIGSTRQEGIRAWASGPNGQVRRGPFIGRSTAAGGHLVIAKIEMNFDGVQERYTVWSHPQITAPTVQGLGDPHINEFVAGDIGTTWASVVVNIGFNDGIDAIRIASGPMSDDAKVAAVLGSPLYPGNGGDLELRTGVNGATPTIFPEVFTVNHGDTVDVQIISTGGTHVGDPLLAWVTPLTAGVPSGPYGTYFGPTSVFLLSYNPWLPHVLAPGGTTLHLKVPPSVPLPTDIIVQALVINPLAPPPVVTTNGHEVQVR